jgi:hypothetical protein
MSNDLTGIGSDCSVAFSISSMMRVIANTNIRMRIRQIPRCSFPILTISADGGLDIPDILSFLYARGPYRLKLTF